MARLQRNTERNGLVLSNWFLSTFIVIILKLIHDFSRAERKYYNMLQLNQFVEIRIFVWLLDHIIGILKNDNNYSKPSNRRDNTNQLIPMPEAVNISFHLTIRFVQNCVTIRLLTLYNCIKSVVFSFLRLVLSFIRLDYKSKILNNLS